jgi:hypothetical protein
MLIALTRGDHMLKLSSFGASMASKARSLFSARPTAARMPHIGAKEQERAKRCWMSEYMESGEGHLRYRSRRSAPTLCQSARRTVDA